MKSIIFAVLFYFYVSSITASKSKIYTTGPGITIGVGAEYSAGVGASLEYFFPFGAYFITSTFIGGGYIFHTFSNDNRIDSSIGGSTGLRLGLKCYTGQAAASYFTLAIEYTRLSRVLDEPYDFLLLLGGQTIWKQGYIFFVETGFNLFAGPV